MALQTFTLSQSTQKLEHLTSTLAVQFVRQPNQRRYYDLFVPDVIQSLFVRYIKPKLVNKLNLFIGKVGRMSAKIKISNLVIRSNDAEANALMGLVR